jgi:hypothetical protein
LFGLGSLSRALLLKLLAQFGGFLGRLFLGVSPRIVGLGAGLLRRG